MKTVAYLRVSTGGQDLDNQKLAILDYAQRNRIEIDRFVERHVSSRKTVEERGVTALLADLAEGDTLLVSELSRLGRSLGQIIQTVDALVKQRVRFITIKEGIELNGRQDIQAKVMVTMIGLFAEIERDLIAQRTKEGLAAARAKGRVLGRPRGARGKSKLDGKEAAISELLSKQVSKAAIARILGVSRTGLSYFIATRQLAGDAAATNAGDPSRILNVSSTSRATAI